MGKNEWDGPYIGPPEVEAQPSGSTSTSTSLLSLSSNTSIEAPRDVSLSPTSWSTRDECSKKYYLLATHILHLDEARHRALMKYRSNSFTSSWNQQAIHRAPHKKAKVTPLDRKNMSSPSSASYKDAGSDRFCLRNQPKHSV